MDAKTTPNSSLYLFEKFEAGVIHLDAQRNVLAMNDFARRILPVEEKQPFNKLVTSFHPERSKPKVNFLLDEASGCPMANAVPMTMIINIPEQVLLIKVSRLGNAQGETTGFALVFVVAARMDALGFIVLTVKHDHMGILVIHPDNGVKSTHKNPS